MVRTVPVLKTDAELEAFLEQDLSDLDFSQFKPLRHELESKAARVNMRLPKAQLDTLKHEAQRRGIPYQRFMRELLQRGLDSLNAG